MLKMYETSKDLDKNLANFLLNYRNIPHHTTNIAPSIAMCNRTLRSKLHQIRPEDQQKVENLQAEKEQSVLNASLIRRREFKEKQLIWVQPTNDKTWQPAKINKRIGESHLYEVDYNSRLITKHADSIKERLIPVLQINKDKALSDSVVSPGKSVVCASPNHVNFRPTVDQSHENTSLPSCGGKSNSMCVPSIDQSIGTEQDSVVQSKCKHKITGSKHSSQSYHSDNVYKQSNLSDNVSDKSSKLTGNKQLSDFVPRRSPRLAEKALKLAEKT